MCRGLRAGPMALVSVKGSEAGFQSRLTPATRAVCEGCGAVEGVWLRDRMHRVPSS